MTPRARSLVPVSSCLGVLALVTLAAVASGACAEGSNADSEPANPTRDPASKDSGGSDDPDVAVVDFDAGYEGEDDAGGSKVDASKPDTGVDATAPGDPCATALAKFAYDFDNGVQGWTHGISDDLVNPPSWPYDPWKQGSATFGTNCNSGKCFGTELTQNYAQCERGYLLSPSVDISACSGQSVTLAFHHAYIFFQGAYGGTTWYDGGVVEVSGDDGASWNVPPGTYPGTVKINPNRTSSYQCVQSTDFGVNNKPGYVGSLAANALVELEVPAVAVTNKFRLRFSFASGVSSQTTDANTSRSATAPGWRIDDVSLEKK